MMRQSWPTAHRRRRSPSGWALYLLLALLALAPLPFGGSRPIFWAVFAAPVGLVVCAYSLHRMWRGEGFPFALRRVGVEAYCWFLFCSYALVQALPLGQATQSFVSGKTGESIALGTLSITPGTTLLVAVQLLAYGGTAWLAAQVSVRNARARSLQLGIVIISSGYALYGLIALTELHDTILGFAKWAYFGSATSAFVNRNTFATFLSLSFSCGTARIITDVAQRRNAGERLGGAFMHSAPVIVCLMFILAALFASNSRMGLLAGVSGSLVTAALTLNPHSGLRRFAAASIIAAVAVSAAAWFYGQGLVERLASVERDLDVRSDLYWQVWQLILRRPWIGFGGGSFEYAFPLIHAQPVSFDLLWDRAHSTYLSLWAEFGFFFGSLPIVALVILAIRLASAPSQSPAANSSRAGAIGAIIVVAVHSLTDFSLEIQGVAYFFVAIVGLGAGSTFSAGNEPSRTAPAASLVQPAAN